MHISTLLQTFIKVSEVDQFFGCTTLRKCSTRKNRVISKRSAQDAAPRNFLTSGLKLGIFKSNQMLNARLKVVNLIGIFFFFIEMTRNVTQTHCHFTKIPDQFFCTEQVAVQFLSNVPAKSDKQTDLGKSAAITSTGYYLLSI